MPTKARAAAEAMSLLARVPYGRIAATRRALPFIAPARHIVSPDALLIRIHMGLGYHVECSGAVVAYAGDNLAPSYAGTETLSTTLRPSWSVQCIGTAAVFQPTEEDIIRFGASPRLVDDEPFEPLYMRLVPELCSVHRFDPVCDKSVEQPRQHTQSTII